MFVSQSFILVRFGQLLCNADIRIVNIMKVYMERNNLQLELIRYSKSNVDFIHGYFCKATDSPTERIAGTFKRKQLRLFLTAIGCLASLTKNETAIVVGRCTTIS